LLFVLTIFIIFSGCVEEGKVTQSNESAYQGPVNITPGNISSTTLSSEEENVPEIEVKSFSSIYMHDNIEKIDGYLFSWDNVPGNESHRLISYLKNDLNISWVDNAQIVKTNNNETIRVFTSGNSLELTLDNNENLILTTIDSVPFYLSKIKKENGKIYVYRLEEYKYVYNITEKYYAVYNLSITNNGSKNIDFKLNELNVRDRNHVFNTTIELESLDLSFNNEILSDLEKETKLEDTTLSPGQTINGSVVFQVNSSYNSSDDNAFQLSYKEIPISSDSFKKSNEALNMAERYNYSVVFGISPYDLYGFVNYVNKSTIEFIKKRDSDGLLNDSTENRELPEINVVYAIKVIPEKSIRSIFERNIISGPESYPENRFIVIDNTGEELINASETDIIAILKNQTYELHSGGSRYIRGSRDIPQMNFSNATLVITSYQYICSPGVISFIDQDLILDDEKNIILARYHCQNYIS